MNAAALEVLHADEYLLVLDKPAGVLSVPGRGEDKQDCLSARAQKIYPDALVVHRLDMATSGLMLMARGADMQRRLGKAFEERQIQKRYVAVVDGMPDQRLADGDGWSVIDLPIIVDWPRRPLRIIEPLLGKPSVTRWRLLATDRIAMTSRLALEPVTGRSHQLRVHLQAIGHAILGDPLYANDEICARSVRLLLHAQTLEFNHPATGRPMRFESPEPF
ncbi:MAG: RluA family pseudouridine synthase [Comamonadaceae bacterium]|nr:MAG: RluA family pseudouridine synthase [Comamonadaceae bacterium]